MIRFYSKWNWKKYVNIPLPASDNEQDHIKETYDTTLPGISEEVKAVSSDSEDHHDAFSSEGFTRESKVDVL